MSIKTICWKNGCVELIDQRLLPHRLVYRRCRDVRTLWIAIKNLTVRGAPALGAAAAFGVLLGVQNEKTTDTKRFVKKVFEVADYIGTSRPTAVNLFAALESMKRVAIAHATGSVAAVARALHAEAMRIYEEDRRVCRAIGSQGARLITNGQRILTVCNAGALATVDYGTALGVLYSAKEAGKKFSVYACETRPLLQGARLTAWELMRNKIEVTLICDNMAATLMKQGKVDMVITGADRIAANGDAANKIGTYSLAVLAKHHRIPFYIAAPRTTFDLSIKTGTDIPIEERDASEVRGFSTVKTAPPGVAVYNPAFDVTDHRLITAFITEKGCIAPRTPARIRELLTKSGKKYAD